MGPRRETPEDAASRQLTESNNTLNQFLGGSSRRPSWLNGGSAPINPRPPTQASPQRTPATPSKDADTRPAVDRRQKASASSSPHLPNDAPTVQPQSAQSSISPPRTPITPHSPAPIIGTHIEPPVGDIATPKTDETRKRKQMDLQQHAAPPKRLSIGGAQAGSPLHPYSPTQAANPGEGVVQLSAPYQLPSTLVSSTAMRPPMHSGQASNSQSWQQAYGSVLPQQQIHDAPLQSHTHAQPPHTLPGNATVQTTSAPIYHQPANIMRRVSTASPTAASPTTPNPAQQRPSPQSQVSGCNPTSQMSRGLAPQPAQPGAPLPVILPYTRVNCEEKIEKYRQHRHWESTSPMDGVESSRTDILLQAAKADDSLFLFIHQMVSQSAINLNNIPSILRNVDGFYYAISLLNNLLAGDQIKNDGLLEFFAALPCSLTFLAMERPDNYQLLVNHMAHMSWSLNKGWRNLKQVCIGRGYPPLPTELWGLNICSPTLMNVFFLAALRQIWPLQHPNYVYDTHESAKKIFEEAKQALYSGVTGWVLPPELLQHLDAIFHNKYMMFVQQVAMRNSQSRQPSQSHPGSTPIGVGTANHINGHTPQAPMMQYQPHPASQMPPVSAQPTTPVQPVQQNNGLLIPPSGAPTPNQAATPTWQLSALHQAHLRDPRYEVAEKSEPELLYQSVTTFAVAPRRLTQHELYQTYSFAVPANARVALTTDPQNGQRKVREIKNESLQYRLRIVKVGSPPSNGQERLEQDWVLKATSWPMHLYYQLNGQQLEVRRKQHHTKDLPIDVTEFINAGHGGNTLEIYANVSYEDAATLLLQYAFAVEVVGAKSHETILEECQRRVIKSEDSLRAITQSLNRRVSTRDDDDIIIDDARTNITIYDPICQGKICELPARGEDCRHRECFDLLTFLQTRPREEPYWPSDADAWKCPICLADVRPHRIVIDGFLKDVREKLVAEGKEKTRVIVVEADGSWTPKIEDAVDSERSTPEADKAAAVSSAAPVIDEAALIKPAQSSPHATAAPGQQPKRRQAIVIDLCEDD